MIITTYQFYCVQERVAIPVIENYHYIIISKPYKKTVVTICIRTICIVTICIYTIF